MREVVVFCRTVKAAQHANNIVSLNNNAKAYNNKANNINHNEISVRVHFLPE
jgi:hypothetical protein